MSSPNEVARYYDSNTGWFLRVGARGSHAIHRRLWGPGVRSAQQAAEYVNVLVGAQIEKLVPLADPVIVDFGCGVGGTLLHLSGRFRTSRLHGVTISPRQHEIATRLSSARGIGDRCHFTVADFESVDLGFEADVIVAVESFVHSSSPERFLRSAASHLSPGGCLVIVDDFLMRGRHELDDAALRTVGDFERGWRLSSLCTVDQCTSHALGLSLGTIEATDLTDMIRVGRPRDRLVGAVSSLSRVFRLVRFPFFANAIGGGALHAGLRRGVFGYHMVVLRKS